METDSDSGTVEETPMEPMQRYGTLTRSGISSNSSKRPKHNLSVCIFLAKQCVFSLSSHPTLRTYTFE